MTFTLHLYFKDGPDNEEARLTPTFEAASPKAAKARVKKTITEFLTQHADRYHTDGVLLRKWVDLGEWVEKGVLVHAWHLMSEPIHSREDLNKSRSIQCYLFQKTKQ